MNYLWTGYGLTWLALAVYAWRLERRRRSAEREIAFRRDGSGTGAAGGAPAGDPTPTNA